MIQLKTFIGQLIIQIKTEEELFDDSGWQLQKIKSRRNELLHTINVRYQNLDHKKEWSLFDPKIKKLDQLIDEKLDNFSTQDDLKTTLIEVKELIHEQNKLLRIQLGY